MDSLKLHAGFVETRFVLDLVPRFTPEDIGLGDYGFVPFVRNGLAAAITAQPAGVRPTVEASFEVAASDGSGTPAPVPQRLTLYGPGDVTGIDASQIVRREPVSGTPDAEETFLAHIEFDRPDFPWLFSPKPASGDRLDPWLALVVCEEEHVRERVGPANTLPGRFRTRLGELQPLGDNAFFAHAQVVGAERPADGALVQRGAVAGSVETRLSEAHAPANLSRLLCPRRLEPGRRYVAALVPAFDCGVRAGLGLGGGTLAPAWTRDPAGGDDESEIVLPFYDLWSFGTAPKGDFKSLAEKIKGIAAPWEIGRRFVDLRRPGSGITELPQGAPGAVQVLDCALVSPAQAPADAPVGRWPTEQRDELRLRVDRANADEDPDLPRVGPRLYARFQRGASRLGPVFGTAPFAETADEAADGDWFAALNTDPARRIVAGLGTRVVQKDQEKLMQAAWAQVEGIRAANAALVWAGFAEVLNVSVTRRHLEPMELGTLAQVTRAVHGKIRAPVAGRTVWGAVTESRTADRAMSAAFRRATRATGPVMRRQAGERGLAALPLVTAGAAFRDHRVTYRAPDGVVGLSDVGLSAIPADIIARVMNVEVDRAPDELRARVRTLAESGTAFTQLAAGDWQIRAGVKPGEAVGRVLLEAVERTLPGRMNRGSAVSAGPVASIFAGLAGSDTGLRRDAIDVLERVGRAAPAQTLRFRSAPPVRPDIVRPGGGVDLGGAGRVGGLEDGIAGVGAARTAGGLGAAGVRTTPGLAGSAAGRTGVRPAGTGLPTGPVVFDRDRPRPGDRPPEPDAPMLRFDSAASRKLATSLAELDRGGPARFAADLKATLAGLGSPQPIAVDLPPLAVTRTALLAELRPERTARAAFAGRITRRPDFLPADWLDRVGLRPIMAAPVFLRPMFEALHDYDPEWLIPGLGTIAERNFVTLLNTNAAFSEAFLVGLSDEMGRELLWRDYPTDQRGTYFKRFWDGDEDELLRPIHRFPRLPIGSQFSVGGDAAPGVDRLTLVVKGELVRRYPDLVVAALRAGSPQGEPPVFIAGSEARILFHERLPPDHVLTGFDLTVSQVETEGWWFILAENPSAPRFGMAAVGEGNLPAGGPIERNALDWNDLGRPAERQPPRFLSPALRTVTVTDERSHPTSVTWPGNSAVVARTLLRNPVRAAFRGSSLLQSIRTVS